METTTTPSLKDAYTAIPLEITSKVTQSKVTTVFYAKEKMRIEYPYGQVKNYEVGDKVWGEPRKDGLGQFDEYGLVLARTIPWDKVTRKDFITTRETKITTWEILDK